MSKKILVIKSAITGEKSISNKYVAELVGLILKNNDTVTLRDLSKNDVGTLNSSHLQALIDPNSATSKKFDSLIDELKNCDVLVIGAPMYNLNISGLLKNYLDAITINNKTFKFNSDGTLEGLVKNKKAYIVTSRGGFHTKEGRTFQEYYLRCHLNYLGITDIQFIFLEGVGTGLTNEQIEADFRKQTQNL